MVVTEAHRNCLRVVGGSLTVREREQWSCSECLSRSKSRLFEVSAFQSAPCIAWLHELPRSRVRQFDYAAIPWTQGLHKLPSRPIHNAGNSDVHDLSLEYERKQPALKGFSG